MRASGALRERPGDRTSVAGMLRAANDSKFLLPLVMVPSWLCEQCASLFAWPTNLLMAAICQATSSFTRWPVFASARLVFNTMDEFRRS